MNPLKLKAIFSAETEKIGFDTEGAPAANLAEEAATYLKELNIAGWSTQAAAVSPETRRHLAHLAQQDVEGSHRG